MFWFWLVLAFAAGWITCNSVYQFLIMPLTGRKIAKRLMEKYHIKPRGKMWKLWSSIDGGHHWEVIGESDDKDDMIRHRNEVNHMGGDTYADMVILPNSEEPCFEKYGSGVG